VTSQYISTSANATPLRNTDFDETKSDPSIHRREKKKKRMYAAKMETRHLRKKSEMAWLGLAWLGWLVGPKHQRDKTND